MKRHKSLAEKNDRFFCIRHLPRGRCFSFFCNLFYCAAWEECFSLPSSRRGGSARPRNMLILLIFRRLRRPANAGGSYPPLQGNPEKSKKTNKTECTLEKIKRKILSASQNGKRSAIIKTTSFTRTEAAPC